MTSLRLGTRGSQLALWQARRVADALRERGGPSCDLRVIRTSGDRLTEAPLSESGGKRLFVKELEDALLQGQIDLAVHSAKDMPAALPDGLTLGAVLPREDPRDALVLPAAAAKPVPADLCAALAALGAERRVGTGSLRRIAQLRRLMPRARFQPVRGNLDTRLRKLDAGEHDLLVLASAGLRRLGWGDRISLALPVEACIPAPGQGTLAVEVRSDDETVRREVALLHDATSGAVLAAERALVLALGGSCQMPLGAYATAGDTDLVLHAILLSADGERALRGQARGLVSEAETIARRVAEQLRSDGAEGLLDDLRGRRTAIEGSP